MKIRCAALIVAVVSCPVFTRAANAPIEFSGVMTAGDQTRIALKDTATKTTTWVQAGEDFKGYNVARYDAKEEAVFLKKSGQETRLPLVSAKTGETRRSAPTATAPAAPVDAAAAAIQANLRHLAAAARQYQLERGVSTVNYADLVGPDKQIREVKPFAGENYSTLSFGPDVTAIGVTTASGATVTHELTPTATAGSANIAAQPATPSTNVSNSGAPPISGPGATLTSSTAIAEVLEPTGRQAASPTYMIQGGDTWQKISASTGIPVQQLKQLNPAILEGSPLPSGQTIRVR